MTGKLNSLNPPLSASQRQAIDRRLAEDGGTFIGGRFYTWDELQRQCYRMIVQFDELPREARRLAIEITDF